MDKYSNVDNSHDETFTEQESINNDDDLEFNDEMQLTNKKLIFFTYKKAIKAAFFSFISPRIHVMIKKRYCIPCRCHLCQNLMWAQIEKQLKCSTCRIKCHKKCRNLLKCDCKINISHAKEKSRKSRGNANDLKIEELIEYKLNYNLKKLDFIKKIFTVDHNVHSDLLLELRRKLIEDKLNWNIQIMVKVISAKNLTPKNRDGYNDPYVIIQIGNKKKMTKTVKKSLDPVWNESFYFECDQNSKNIKIMVWDEDRHIFSKFKHIYSNEKDGFLGQVIIDINTLCGETVKLYNLDKRKNKSVASGSIKIAVKVVSLEDENIDPYTTQYYCLHQTIFDYLYRHEQLLENLQIYEFFSGYPQDIIEEFAICYKIDIVYQWMTHFICLWEHYNFLCVAKMINNLLAKINSHYAHVIIINQVKCISEFEKCDLTLQKFISIIGELSQEIIESISKYKINFPSNDPENLEKLDITLDIFSCIIFYKMKYLNDDTVNSATYIEECLKPSGEYNYQYILTNCNRLYRNIYKQIIESDPTMESPNFWQRLITLLALDYDENLTIYDKIFQKIFYDFKLSRITSMSIWTYLTTDLKIFLDQNSSKNPKNVNSHDFINLFFNLKWFKEKIMSEDDSIIFEDQSYLEWFDPYIVSWLDENEIMIHKSCKVAYFKDRQNYFEKCAEDKLYSTSVVDIFTLLNQSFEVIERLKNGSGPVDNKHIKRFSQTICMILLSYSNLIKSDFETMLSEIKIAYTLLNNIHQLRIELDLFYHQIGGNDLPEDIQEILKELQEKLNNILDDLIVIHVKQVESEMVQLVKQMSKDMSQINKSDVVAASSMMEFVKNHVDYIIKPLIIFLDQNLTEMSDTCTNSNFRRILKFYWKKLMTCYEHYIILAPVHYIKKTIEQTKITGLFSQIKKSIQSSRINEENQSLVYKCKLMEVIIDNLSTYFNAEGKGLKESFISECPIVTRLKTILKLAILPTNEIIRRFVELTKEKNPSNLKNFGFVSLYVELTVDPSTKNKMAVVKINSLTDLVYHERTSMRPYLEIHIIGGEDMTHKKWKYVSKHKKGSPINTNESFKFVFESEAKFSQYEMEIICKDYYIARSPVIGVAVISLMSLELSGCSFLKIPLLPHIELANHEYDIVRMLALRIDDENAREFVCLKSIRRDNC